MGRKCIVPGCGNTGRAKEIMHILPIVPHLCYEWLRIVQREELKYEDRKKYRICDVHFSDKMKIPVHHNKSNLKKLAVPDIHLPSLPVPSEGQTEMTISEHHVEYEKVAASPENHKANENGIAHLKNLTPRTPKSRKDLRTSIRLLNSADIIRQNQLTPRAKKMYTVAKNMIKTARRLDLENADLRKRLDEAKNVNMDDFLQGKVNESTITFFKSQIQLQNKKSKGRRFSIDDKVFALSLLKQSPKGYRLLQKMFALPSKKTLMNVLSKIPFTCGLNGHIMNSLRTSVEKMFPTDKYCCLVFDEMSLSTSLSYSKKYDALLGFVDCGQGLKRKFADHAFVFMATGIQKRWKQPICFYFSEASMSAAEIAVNIKLVVTALQVIGLKVVATICDQLAANSAAIRMLKETTTRNYAIIGKENRMFGFSIGNTEIITLYDPPHLLKGIRNNMLEADVKFKWKKEEQLASWHHIIQFYKRDQGDYDSRLVNKLNDRHVYKQQMNKMKVSPAAQVFSQRLFSAIRFCVNNSIEGVQESATHTADFLLFMDKLFDSVNGTSIKSKSGKILRCAVTTSSPHIEFWNEALKVLSTVKFVKSDRREFVPPSVKNWIHTIQGFKCIWNKLKLLNCKSFKPRYFNQDPVENFFGCIRSHGCRNINPTCSSFISSFKTLVVNNFMSSHSPGANYEDDGHEGALNPLQQFLSVEPLLAAEDIEPEEMELSGDNEQFIFQEDNEIAVNTHGYIAGYLAKVLLKIVGKCEHCKAKLISDIARNQHGLIACRMYGPRTLLLPHTEFITLFSQCNQIIHKYLPQLCTSRNLQKKLVVILMKYTKNNFTCMYHNLYKYFLEKFVIFYIYMWTKNVNRILHGDDKRAVNDEMKVIAQQKYWKSKRKKRFRLTKRTCLAVLTLVEENLEFPNDRNNSVSPMKQLLTALRFYASAGHLTAVADFGGMHTTTVPRFVARVSRALALLRPQCIHMPRTAAELAQVQNQFFQIAAFPRVLGTIDGTHIRIQSPSGEDAEVFRNRKGYFSINVQATCNASLEITDIVARWPGSAHDSTIFNNSRLRAEMDNGDFPNTILLGDSGYPLRDYFLTPLANPVTRQEQLYNEAHIRTRNTVERLFGNWKRRFPVLAYGIRLKIDTVMTVIVATAVLQNIARKMHEAEPPLPEEIIEQDLEILIQNGQIRGVPNVEQGNMLMERG